MNLRIVPLTLEAANDFVTCFHRHHKKSTGHRFSIGLETPDSILVAVCIVGRPVARGFDGSKIAEVTRLCAVPGISNACSKLYSAAARICREMGFKSIITYTLATESGISLQAAGWMKDAKIKGRTWSCPSRPRIDKHPTVDKIRWKKVLNSERA